MRHDARSGPRAAARLAVCLAAVLVAVALPTRGQAAGPGTITTIAGGWVADGGPATSGILYHPSNVAVDSVGNVYIVDYWNCRVRRVSGGIITTFAGNGTCGYSGDGGSAASAALSQPYGVAVGAGGDLYIADYLNCRVRRVSGGTITTFAGGTCGYGGDGGPATTAALWGPSDVAVDGSGNVYIADAGNCRVRRVSAGIITTFAGNGTCSYGGDSGPATSASLYAQGIALDGSGNLYIADQSNCRVRRVSGGIITTFAGNGTCGYSGDGGAATGAALNYPWGLAAVGGNLYIADQSNCRVRRVSGGVITTFAGGGGCGYGGDGGPAASAQLITPTGVATDGSGNVYIADQNICRVRWVSGGIITTFAGNWQCGYGGDGSPATSAAFDRPGDVSVDSGGSVYISDAYTCRVRRVSGGIITTFAGGGGCGFGGDGGAAASASLNFPGGLATDSGGNVYIADTSNCRVRRVSGGIITTFAGNGTCGFSGDGGPATSAQLVPWDVAVDSGGNVYVADYYGCRVRRVSAGIITTFAGNGTCGYSGDGGLATSAELDLPAGIATDGVGDVYITGSPLSGDCRVRRVSGGIITTLAGNGTCGYSGDGGAATGAALRPADVAADNTGNVYIADYSNCRLRRVSSGTITTFAGNGTCGYGGDGGPAVSATLGELQGVAVDASGNVFVADSSNFRVREVYGAAASVGGIAEAPDVSDLPAARPVGGSDRGLLLAVAGVATSVIVAAAGAGWYVSRSRRNK